MTTDEIISDLRQNGLTSASIYTRMERAANRLEELERANKNTLADLAVAIERRDEALKNQQPTTVVRQLTTRQEPSRLEIAAMAMQGMLAASSFDTLRLSKSAFEYADTLIAAAKEVQS